MPHLPAHTILGVLHDFEEGGGPQIVKYENTWKRISEKYMWEDHMNVEIVTTLLRHLMK